MGSLHAEGFMGDLASELGYHYAAPIRRITVTDYHRIGEAGVFRDDERVELLDGLILEKSPIGHRHGYATRTLSNLLSHAVGQRAIVDVNAPLALTPDSQPLPDVMLLRPPFALYRERLPRPADVLLLIEIAETARSYLSGAKAQTYAEAGVREFWIVDLVQEEIAAFREPQAGGFGLQEVLNRNASLAPVPFPDASIRIADFLEPAAPTRSKHRRKSSPRR
jgi:Uma2 family endonuclease